MVKQDENMESYSACDAIKHNNELLLITFMILSKHGTSNSKKGIIYTSTIAKY